MRQQDAFKDLPFETQSKFAPFTSTKYHILSSYGAVTEILAFIEPIEVLTLQALNQLMYQRNIARVQIVLKLYSKRYLYFTKSTSRKFRWTVFVYDNITRLAKPIENSYILDFQATQSVQVAQSLFTFSKYFYVKKFDNLFDSESICMLHLNALNKRRDYSSLCNFNDKEIYVIGGA